MAIDHNTTKKNRHHSCCQPEPPTCPECGQLECLCRPRFFAGQLLSEQDLNRLDRYIVKKHRLHNRYLHGWGVVCGLEVTCHPCDDEYVNVSTGYAIGPCGEDIIVCKPDSVNICELIKQCRDRERADNECRPYGYSPECKGAEEQWVLAVRYQETPSRGVTALRGGTCGEPAKACGCSDGSSHCSNGAVGTADCSSFKNRKPRGAPAECEPTLVCESYRYEVFRAPENKLDDDKRYGLQGALIETLRECYQPLAQILGQAPQPNMSPQAQFQACCRVKKSLKEYLANHPITDCELRKEIDCIVCPLPTLDAEAFKQAMAEAGLQFLVLMHRLIVACVCHALQPPCPKPTSETRVPLAIVTVSCGTCRVLRVCNWTTLRRFVTTFPNLQYWLSWLPHGRYIRQYLEYICCDLAGLRERLTVCKPQGDEAGAAVAGLSVRPQVSEVNAETAQTFSNMAFSAFSHSTEAFTLDAFLSGLNPKAGVDTASILTKLERDNPEHTLFLNLLAQPLFSGAVAKRSPQGIAGSEAPFSLFSAFLAGAEESRSADLKSLKEELAGLKKRLVDQENEIAALHKKVGNSP
jgi:hypothetical protein